MTYGPTYTLRCVCRHVWCVITFSVNVTLWPESNAQWLQSCSVRTCMCVCMFMSSLVEFNQFFELQTTSVYEHACSNYLLTFNIMCILNNNITLV